MDNLKGTKDTKSIYLEMFPDTDPEWLDREIEAGRVYMNGNTMCMVDISCNNKDLA
jgi:hypothetical protein